MTKLRLDFSLDTMEERKNFITNYLDKITFTPTQDDVEMMGNYILWGKDENGQSPSKTGEIEIETRHKTWNRQNEESLDALLEQPGFNETNTFPTTPIKVSKQEFSRKEALEQAPSYLKNIFVDLFQLIDELDLKLNYYDFNHGKRKNPPREELLKTITPERQRELEEEATHLTQFQYLKLRHQLVELRTQQYTLRDSYAQQIQRTVANHSEFVEEEKAFEGNIMVYPLGIMQEGSGLMDLIFRPEQELLPQKYSEDELKLVSDFLWEKLEEARDPFYFDFCDERHIGELLGFTEELQDQEKNQYTEGLINTLFYYLEFSRLEPMHYELLKMKINKQTNQYIQHFINQKYNKTYTINYISTIFRQKIIPSIAAAAQYHLNIIQNLFFEEEFKTCAKCGNTYLICSYNFVKKSRSKDGFNSKCKCCEKIERKEKKQWSKNNETNF